MTRKWNPDELGKIVRTEHGEQKALIDWVQLNLTRLPQLHMLYAVPNGGARPGHINRHGKRVSIAGALLQAEGQRRGVPDLCLDYPARNYHGLRIEMKKPGGKLSRAQADWLTSLSKLGYCADVCYGTDEAIAAIERYLKDDIPPAGMVWPEWSFTWEYGV